MGLTKHQFGEGRYAGFAAKLSGVVGYISSPGTFQVSGFFVTYNPTRVVVEIDGMRLRALSGVVKTAGGESVISFDEEGGVTHDTQLAAPMLVAFDIPEG